MEQKRKFPRWVIVLVVIVLVCAGVKVWYDRLCYGEIDISDSAPSKEMLLHILEHADELAAQPDLFEVDTDEARTIVDYIGNPSYEYATVTYFEDAANALANHTDTLDVSACYYRDNYSDYWDIVLPWSTLNISINVTQFPGYYAYLYIHDSDAETISDAPLREMMSAIESIIGTP